MNSRPIAYLITWTTYATWLRGDQRGWTEPNVVTAPQAGEAVREQLKAWATRRLKTLSETGDRERFRTVGGDVRLIDDEEGLVDAADYVENQQ